MHAHDHFATPNVKQIWGQFAGYAIANTLAKGQCVKREAS